VTSVAERILSVLEEEGGGLRLRDLSDMMQRDPAAIHSGLRQLLEDKKVYKDDRGAYYLMEGEESAPLDVPTDVVEESPPPTPTPEETPVPKDIRPKGELKEMLLEEMRKEPAKIYTIVGLSETLNVDRTAITAVFQKMVRDRIVGKVSFGKYILLTKSPRVRSAAKVAKVPIRSLAPEPVETSVDEMIAIFQEYRVLKDKMIRIKAILEEE
jgi:predicted transcriptional regulator